MFTFSEVTAATIAEAAKLPAASTAPTFTLGVAMVVASFWRQRSDHPWHRLYLPMIASTAPFEASDEKVKALLLGNHAVVHCRLPTVYAPIETTFSVQHDASNTAVCAFMFSKQPTLASLCLSALSQHIILLELDSPDGLLRTFPRQRWRMCHQRRGMCRVLPLLCGSAAICRGGSTMARMQHRQTVFTSNSTLSRGQGRGPALQSLSLDSTVDLSTAAEYGRRQDRSEIQLPRSCCTGEGELSDALSTSGSGLGQERTRGLLLPADPHAVPVSQKWPARVLQTTT